MLAIKILGAIAAVVVVAVVAVGLAMYFRVVPIPGPILALLVGAKPPEYSARYYPPDTLSYAWVTLVPVDEQLNDMQDIWERFNEYPAFTVLIEELQEDFEDETGIDFEDEVQPWIGPEVGAAVIRLDVPGGSLMSIEDGDDIGEAITAAVTVGVRDQDAAADFLVKWLRYMSIESDADFADGSYRGFDTWVDESAYQAYALAGDWLVYATDEKTLHDILKRIDGDDSDSLAEQDNFLAAQTALPERRFSSAYLDYEQALELAEEFTLGLSPLTPGMPGPTAFANQAPAWVAGSTTWVERGIVTETVSPTTAGFGLEPGELQEPADLLPDDTLGFIAGAFDPNVDHWRVALAEYRLADALPWPELIDEINAGLAEAAPDRHIALGDDATLADALDAGLEAVAEITGIDLEGDFFDHLAGESILAVREFDFDAVEDDPAANAVEAVMMLSYEEVGKDDLSDTMSEVADLLEEYVGLVADRVDVGADDDAVVFELGLLGMMMTDSFGYRPGYVLHDQHLTIGTTEQALETIVGIQNGRGASLSSDAEYRRAVSHLAGGRQLLGYVDAHGIIAQLDADELGLEPGDYRLLQEGIGVVGFGVASGDEYDRGVAVLTLFPE